MPTPLNVRSGRKRQRLVNEFHAHCRKANAACWLCGNPIDYAIPDRHRHPLRFSTDELVPVAIDPASAFNPAGFRPAHACCNSSRGHREPTPAVRMACAAVYRKHMTKAQKPRRRTLSAAW